MGLRLPDRSATTLPELQRDVLQLYYQLGAGAEAQLHRDVHISSAGTKFAHGLRGIPRSVFVFPKQYTEGPPYEQQAADSALIYLAAVPTTVVLPFVSRAAGTGYVGLVGAQVGDTVEVVVDMSTGANVTAYFESTATSADAIYQNFNFGAAHACFAVLCRPVTINCDILVVP